MELLVAELDPLGGFAALLGTRARVRRIDA
jgi:hypothetical protein